MTLEAEPDVGDWAWQIATIQACYPGPALEHIADRFAAGQPLDQEEQETLLEWAECVDARAFLPALSEVFERLVELLKEERGDTEEARKMWELVQELDALRQEHETSPCVTYKWLARRTYRYMETPAITLKQYQRLTGHRHPGPANIIEGDLVPWEYAVDEVADRLGMSTDEFANCVLAAHDREARIFSILEELKEAAL